MHRTITAWTLLEVTIASAILSVILAGAVRLLGAGQTLDASPPARNAARDRAEDTLDHLAARLRGVRADYDHEADDARIRWRFTDSLPSSAGMARDRAEPTWELIFDRRAGTLTVHAPEDGRSTSRILATRLTEVAIAPLADADGRHTDRLLALRVTASYEGGSSTARRRVWLRAAPMGMPPNPVPQP